MFNGTPSELASHMKQIVAEVTNCRVVADHDDRTRELHGPVTTVELVEIKNRFNLLLLVGAEQLVEAHR